MFSYQHLYHAGSLADVHKHAFLSVLIDVLTQKDRALSYLETHAGRGAYDLSCPEALKTGEAKGGVLKLLSEEGMDPHHPYYQALAAHQKKTGASSYPGSPAIAHFLLRSIDQLHLMECHPQEIQHLRRNMRASNIHVHQRDGYEGVLALCPPMPRRGLVFIDPTYEDKGEYEKVVTFTQKVAQRWPQAIVLVWYPILKAGHHKKLEAALEKSGLDTQTFQLDFPKDLTGYSLEGSALYLLNPPFGSLEPLQECKASLARWLESARSR